MAYVLKASSCNPLNTGLHYNVDDIQIKKEFKEELSTEDIVVCVKTEPVAEGQCNCIDSAPIYLNSVSGKFNIFCRVWYPC